MPSDRRMKIDDTERQIINALLRDGRASSRELSAATGIAEPTVAQRVDQLETSGVVSGYEPRIDYASLGYDVTAVFKLTVDGDGLPEVAERLGDHQRMIGVYEVTGSHDVVAIGKFTDTAEMNERIKQLLTDDDITGVETSVVLNTVEEYGQFQLDSGE